MRRRERREGGRGTVGAECDSGAGEMLTLAWVLGLEMAEER